MEIRRLIHRHCQQERAYNLELSLPYFYRLQLDMQNKEYQQICVFSGRRWC